VKTARTFAYDANSIPAARRFVLAALGSVTAEQRDAISVMVSELAMNAVEHAHTPFQVAVEVTDGSLRVEVSDSGGGTPAAQPQPDATSPRGRGLFIVGRLSDAWGTTSSGGSATSVWFTVTLGAPADSATESAITESSTPADRPASPTARQRPGSPPRSPRPGRYDSPSGSRTRSRADARMGTPA
jgi:anti-sigma regulatory factor (Ser/Thr protein kinase)